MIGTSMHRVAEQTADHVNDRIRKQTEMNIAYYMAHPERIDQRLHALREEWDIERALETGASSLSLFGMLMNLRRGRWLLLPLVVQGFFLQHALQGWCPPVEIFRRLGFREQSEIATEYYALKAVRGDFQDVASDPSSPSQARQVMETVRR